MISIKKVFFFKQFSINYFQNSVYIPTHLAALFIFQADPDRG